MSISIRTNLSALHTARTLGTTYADLSDSVRRLSSGLRVETAADDAAGLAVRELMRSDITTLHQGIRNANDAVSLIQTADGALAVIDEKLIRMKELAQQAATGTYNSTQRLIINSEYQAMAAEINRIAHATDFNGIKLLDGSLAGNHDGSDLNSTGAMKIHFGPGNDSAEDYYYVEIESCTTEALGLGTPQISGTSGTTKEETLVETSHTFRPKSSYIEYINPDTGNKYYTDGNFYFSDINNPAGTILDWETDGELIKKLKMQQRTVSSYIDYQTYIDPDTNREYYHRANTFTVDPYDPQGTLDPNNSTDNAIITRLQKTNKGLRINITWKVYKDPDGKNYYSYNDGKTFVPKQTEPSSGVIDSKNSSDRQIINTLSPDMTTKTAANTIAVKYSVYVDATTSRKYYSSDGGNTFVSSYTRPDTTKLDPVTDYDIIARLHPEQKQQNFSDDFPIWLEDGTQNKYYTLDYGKTFFTDILHPENIILDTNNPADASAVAKLKPSFRHTNGSITCNVYEDSSDNNKKYYSFDNGTTYFDDLGDHTGSTIDTNDPNYTTLVANLNKIDSTIALLVQYDCYRSLRNNRSYYSSDGGLTFVMQPNSPADTALDPNNPQDADIISHMVPVCNTDFIIKNYKIYQDSTTGTLYYSTDGNTYRTYSGNIILDSNDPADITIINNFQIVQNTFEYRMTETMPEVYYIYKDERSGTIYYSPDDGKTFTTNPSSPSDTGSFLDPTDPADLDVLNNLKAVTRKILNVGYIDQGRGEGSFLSIETQEKAQNALEVVDNAIVKKDNIRAHLGALQNRLENTVTNLRIQAENLSVSESRISDTDVAAETTTFVRSQILSQASLAMLAQANSLPRMLMTLITG